MGAPSTTFIADALALITSDTPHLALYTTNPTAADSGTEVAGGSYARKPITFGSVSAGTIANTIAITFTGVPTATVTHFGIRDALTLGDLKVFGALANTAVVVSGDEITFPVGSITVSLAGS